MPRPHIVIVVGARPNFMKAAPLVRSLQATRQFRLTLVHTGQHYDPELSSLFFRDLKLPRPAMNLGVGSAPRARQVAQVADRFRNALLRFRPDLVIVVGDVNSTLACALGACRTFYPHGTSADRCCIRPRLAHVEAGLRSFDWTMPEEMNRVVTDHLSDFLFAPSLDGVRHLKEEGVGSQRIFFAGNIMIDSLRHALFRAQSSRILERFRLTPGRYALVTLHRPSNVDDPAMARMLVQALLGLGQRLPVVFPMHPRTRKAWSSSGLLRRLSLRKGIHLGVPLGYLDFLKLLASARLVLTDSGGIQEETTILKVPCLTLRSTTERPITITRGTNRLVKPLDANGVLAACDAALGSPVRKTRIPPLWDGRAAQRITRILLKKLSRA